MYFHEYQLSDRWTEDLDETGIAHLQDGGEAALQAFFKVVGQQAQCLKAQRQHASFISLVWAASDFLVPGPKGEE